MPGMRFPAFSIAYLKAALTGFFVRITGDTITGNILTNNDLVGFGTGASAPTGATPGTSTNWSPAGSIVAYGSTQNARIKILGDGQAAVNNMEKYSADATSGVHFFRKGRGSYSAPTQALAADNLGQINYAGIDNGGTPTSRNAAQINAVAISNVTTTSAEGRIVFLNCPAASLTLTEIARWEQATGYSMFGANVVVDANRVYRNRIFTVATLPAGVQGMRTVVSDALAPAFNAAVVGGGAVTIPVFYTGAAWNVG